MVWKQVCPHLVQSVLKKKHKNEETGTALNVLVILQTNSFERSLPGLCFADHSVCWIHAKKKSEIQRRDVKSVHQFFSLPTQQWAYIPYSNFRHTLPEQCLGQCFKSDKNLHLRTLPSGYTTFPAVLIEAHMRQNVSVWERRGQSQYRPHTPLCSAAWKNFSAPLPEEVPRPRALPKTSSLSSRESGGFLARKSYAVVSGQSI